jgi:hypothetical protein
MVSVRHSYPLNELMPSIASVEETIGYRYGEAPEPVVTVVNEVIAELTGDHEARAEYRIFDKISFNSAGASVLIENAVFNIRKIIFSQLKKAEKAALFICTAGEVIGEKSRKSMQAGDLLKGYIFDVAGSIVVESAADRMQTDLHERMAAEGLNITNRFSPGYCGWNVSDQQIMFSFFYDNSCGITLTASSLMLPVKSVSGIIGIGSQVRFAQYQCRLCDDKNCLYRRKGIRPV